MDDGNPISGIIIILFLVLLNALILSAKAALLNLNEGSVKKKAEGGSKRGKQLLKILEQPNHYMNVLELLLGFTVIMIGMIFYLYLLPSVDIVMIKSGMNVDIKIVRPCYYILFTVLLVFVLTIFGTILPKKYAIKHADTVAFRMLGIVRFVCFILKPFSWFIDIVLNLVLKIFGISPSELEDNVTEEEIISMVNEGHEQGVFDAGEVEMISNIIELDEKEAQDIMTNKRKIVAINDEMTIQEALSFMLSESYSRYPLYHDNRDNIIGILHLKDIINAYISPERKDKTLKEIAREPFFVPDTQNINILFHDMQSKNIHMAIVIDEYGQTAGLVALEDFLEEIVGNIQDEYDEDEKLILSVEEASVIVKGSIGLEDLEEELDLSIEHDDFDTLNGLLISLLDRIPGDGETAILDYQGYHFDILETRNKMIERVRISKQVENQDVSDNQDNTESKEKDN